MEAIRQRLSGSWVFKCDTHVDARGTFETLWDDELLRATEAAFAPSSAHHSYNARAGTLRGMHFQHAPCEQAKLVKCVSGTVLDVIVDLRRASSTYLCWDAFEMKQADGVARYIPPGCAHGFLTMQDASTVAYLISGRYSPEHAGVVRWNDPAVGIEWPIENPILSERDRAAPDWRA